MSAAKRPGDRAGDGRHRDNTEGGDVTMDSGGRDVDKERSGAEPAGGARVDNGSGPVVGSEREGKDSPGDGSAHVARPAHGPRSFSRLYAGNTSFSFIANRKWWFALSSVIILAGLVSLGTRGLNLGINFKGGQSWSVQTNRLTVAEATSVVRRLGVGETTVVVLTNQLTHQKTIEVQADLNNRSTAARLAIEPKVTDALAAAAGVSPTKVSFDDVGPTWGGEVTNKAILALIIFFIAVVVYISFRFEFKMAIAALVAVIHDLLVTVGVYSLAGFQVTPDTAIAVLTVLGYSLYDTVVVFDRIGENAKGLGASGRVTYSETVDLSMNQTLARSINTSLVAIIPVLSVLVVGALLLGATTLENFGLALVIGLTSGAYSSIFIASPLLAMMKEREPRYRTIRQRLETRGDRMGILTPAAAAAMAGAAAGGGVTRVAGGRARSAAGTLRPGAARPESGAAGSAAGSSGGVAVRARPAAEDLGADVPAPDTAVSGGASRRPQNGARAAGPRPAPRPRKGKGKGSKGRRR
ncbi:MAG: protein translocase subunit SecF [Actinomycetota bacterium]|nr:protein translocase subunit SecF [Actinomycetota bacterium]